MGNLLPYLSSGAQVKFNLISTIQSNLPEILTFYLGIAICRMYANPVDLKKLIPAILAVYCFHYLSGYIIVYKIAVFGIDSSEQFTFNTFNHAIVTLWKFFKYCGLGMGYYFVMKGIQNQKKITQLEKEKQDAEYAFLRSQINPHLLNGTLKYIYEETLTLSKNLAADVAILRDIMLYSLQSDKDDRLVLLNHEIAHIRNVIKINQLRFNNRLEIILNIKGNTEGVKIIPLILITAVENILKHGVCTDKEAPVKIDLEIDDIKGCIHLNTWNQNRKGPKELSSGIGLDNIKKRLINHYQNTFSLITTATEHDYQLSLSIPFFRPFQTSEMQPTENIAVNNRIFYQTSAV